MRQRIRSWTNLLGSLGFKKRKTRRPQKHRSRFAFRPQVQALEARQLMAGDFSISQPLVTREDVLTGIQFVVSRPDGAGQTSVQYNVNDLTARAGEDYVQPPPGTLTFLEGETSKVISVTLTDDLRTEVDEAFLVKLSNAQGAGIASSEAFGRISDNDAILVIGPESTHQPLVRVYDAITAQERYSFEAYTNFTGGVRVASGDINGDGVPDIITAAGTTGGPHVKVFNGASSNPGSPESVLAQFLAYGSTFTGGVFVSSADVNGDGKDDIITSAGAGGGPHVRVFSGVDQSILQEFLAFPVAFSGGIHVAAGDILGDERAEIIVGSGSGMVAEIRVFAPMVSTGEYLSWHRPYGTNFSGGVYVGTTDLAGDGKAEILTGAGAGGGSHVRALRAADFSEVVGFFAYDAGFTGGVRVAGGDTTGEGLGDIITAPGPGTTESRVRTFNSSGQPILGANGQERSFPYDAAFVGGLYVGGNNDSDLAPQISSISDRSINEDSSTGSIAFTVSDAETSAGALALSYNSSNPTLVPSSGAITFGGSGTNRTLTVTPAANSYGRALISINVLDANGGIVSEAFELTVNPVADTPSVTSSNTDEDEQSTTGLVLSANPADGSSVTHFYIASITGGTLYQNDGQTAIVSGAFVTLAQGNAGLKFSPMLNSTTSGSFQVWASTSENTGGLGGNGVTATITVNPVNDEPFVESDVLSPLPEWSTPASYSIPSLQLLTNDRTGGPGVNEEGQSLTITEVGNPVGGTVSISGSAVIFVIEPYFNGTASFTYRATDNGTTAGSSDPKTAQQFAIVSFPVTEFNNPPQPTGDSLETIEDTTLVYPLALLWGNDAAGPPNEVLQSLTITAVGTATHGTVSIEGANLVFVPEPGYIGPASFSYTVVDNGTTAGASDPKTATGWVTLNIYEYNEAPIAGPDTLSPIAEDSGTWTIPKGELLSNDSPGPASESGQTLTLTNVFNFSSDGGTVSLSESGDVLFTPSPNFVGTARFSYQVTDNGTTNGAPDPKSVWGTVSFVITAVNDAPEMLFWGSPYLTTVLEDHASVTQVRTLLERGANGVTFSDPDSGAQRGIALAAVDSEHGQWAYSADGNFYTDFDSVSIVQALLLPEDAYLRFTPDAVFNGQFDAIGFYVVPREMIAVI